jgi:transcription antitermination factor NusG
MNLETESMNTGREQSGLTSEGIQALPQPLWYAIRTRSRHEKIVSDQLEQRGIESFLPLVRRTRKWSDRVKEVDLPLFAGYNFVRLILSSTDRLRVLQIHGVAGFVGTQGGGTPIPESQIQGIRTVLASKVPFEEGTTFTVGQRVRIRGGSLDGVEGILTAHNGDQSLMIAIEPIQKSLCIRVQGYTVESA